MKQSSTMFLRFVVIGLGLLVLVGCSYTLNELIRGVSSGYAPILIGMYFTLLPFFFALYQTMKLLDNIDKNKAFSKRSVDALKRIKYSALAIGGMYAIGMPYIYMVADADDAPGVVLIGFVFVGASFVVAVASAVFQQLVQKAVDIKSENDLTV